MINKNYETVTSNLSTVIALVSFCISTLLFISYKLFPKNEKIIVISLFFILFATFINLIVFFGLFRNYLFFKYYREYFVNKILIVLANISIALLYLFLFSKISFFHTNF